MNEAFPPLLDSLAVVLRLENVDTDVITPIGRVLEGPQAIVDFAFEPLRFADDGTRRTDDPFADPDRQNAQILIAGRNFGCGSSRETAAQAIRGMGFRCVIAPSFGDIFYSNCLKNGVLAIALGSQEVERIMASADALSRIIVRLAEQRIELEGQLVQFEIDPLSKRMLLDGIDEIGLLESYADAKAEFDHADAAARPWVRERQRA
ncbi:3-isopropylmalate dehydratase small subunit [Alteriqipengyuania lutimaris]|uniref:3-isopropylmalate dehydratase small subunit n=1 Tax=Alteriqipengyuania lutimaris TaxID=1538146 RepID=UPI001CFDFDA4|nr:3-isopropylmalate dehydratase small subunit [Alteriqipengyuania lutimaris]